MRIGFDFRSYNKDGLLFVNKLNNDGRISVSEWHVLWLMCGVSEWMTHVCGVSKWIPGKVRYIYQ